MYMAGIYPTSTAKEVKYLMTDGEACIFIAENQEHVDRILPLYGKLPKLSHVVVIDTTGTFMSYHSALTTYEDLIYKGQEMLDADTGAFEEEVRKVDPNDDLFIVYTSEYHWQHQGGSHQPWKAVGSSIYPHRPISDSGANNMNCFFRK